MSARLLSLLIFVVVGLASCATGPTQVAEEATPSEASAPVEPPSPPPDDVVILTNGDRLTGIVRSLNDDQLFLGTEYAGDIILDWGQVQRLTTASELTVHLTDGVHLGMVTLDGEQGTIHRSDPPEPLEFARAELESINPEWASPDAAPMSQSGAQEFADEIVLNNGDRISGAILSYKGTRMVLDSLHSDEIRIRWKRVVEITSRFPIRVEFIDGEAHEGYIRLRPDGVFILRELDGTEITAHHKSEVSLMERRRNRIEGDITLSATATNGNTETVSTLLKWDLIWKGSDDELGFRGNTVFNTRFQKTTDENLYAQLRYSYLLGGGAGAFTSIELDSDEFRDVRARTVGTVGGSYEFIQKNWLELVGDLGVSYTYESLHTDLNQNYAGGRAGLSFKMDLPWDFELRDTFIFYPSFELSEDWRIRNEARLDRTVFRGWRFEVGLISTYANLPRGGADANSGTFYLGLGYKF